MRLWWEGFVKKDCFESGVKRVGVTDSDGGDDMRDAVMLTRTEVPRLEPRGRNAQGQGHSPGPRSQTQCQGHGRHLVAMLESVVSCRQGLIINNSVV